MLTQAAPNVNETLLDKRPWRGKERLEEVTHTLYTFNQDLPLTAESHRPDNHNPAECLRLLAQLMLNHTWALGEEDPA